MLVKKCCVALTFSLIKLSLFFLSCYSSLNSLEYDEDKERISCQPRILDFDTAVRRTLEQSLILNQAKEEIQARRGMVTQAGLFPNPEFGYDLETSEKGWRYRQDICAISQLIELGGKRQKLVKIANYEYYAALVGYEISKLERLNHLSKAFIRLIAAQEFAQIARSQQVNAQESLRLIQIKVETGKVSILQQNKAHAAQTLADLKFKKALVEFKAAKNSLALLWSSACPDFDAGIYPFFDITPPVPLESYLSKLCDQPEIVQFLYKNKAASHHLSFQKATRIPNVTVTLGYSYDQGDKGIVAGIVVPLPIWNRNQGDIQKAYYDMLKTGDEGKQLWLFLRNKLSNAYLEWMMNYEQIEDLKNLVLKASSETLALTEEGYREGKLGYDEVLEAQKHFFEIQEEYIHSLIHYHNKRAEIDYLTSQID